MEVKCSLNSNYLKRNVTPYQSVFKGSSDRLRRPDLSVKIENKDLYVKRPDATASASGLLGIKEKFLKVANVVINYGKTYKKNIAHTYDHKVVFALIEKELYGKRSIDSYTHDADKMILYLLGFPKSFVSKFHREHSAHHVESGKRPNLRSMLCDNIASSPEFKPEKKNSLRKYYSISKELQSVEGFGEFLEKYNFGENVDFAKIKRIKAEKFEGMKGIARAFAKSLLLLFAHH